MVEAPPQYGSSAEMALLNTLTRLGRAMKRRSELASLTAIGCAFALVPSITYSLGASLILCSIPLAISIWSSYQFNSEIEKAHEDIEIESLAQALVPFSLYRNNSFIFKFCSIACIYFGIWAFFYNGQHELTFTTGLILWFLGIGLGFLSMAHNYDKKAAKMLIKFIKLAIPHDKNLEITLELYSDLKLYREGKSLMVYPILNFIGFYLSNAALFDIGVALSVYARLKRDEIRVLMALKQDDVNEVWHMGPEVGQKSIPKPFLL